MQKRDLREIPVSIRVTRATREWIERRSTDANMTMSCYVEKVLIDAIKREVVSKEEREYQEFIAELDERFKTPKENYSAEVNAREQA